MKHGLCLAGAAALMLLGAGAGFAQDDSNLTAEELAAKFQAQMTRGLVIAPTEGTVADTVDPNAKLPADTTYVAVDPSAQVNIQIKFDFDSAAIGAGEVDKLATLCEVIKASEIPSFKIIGHTDSSGSDSYNQNLSTLRAEEVKRHLVDDCGVPADKLVAVGVGEAFPVDSADPKADVNRRVEFQVGS
jgi:outer membrane protein OmpA-like peptidoglycan-associated protein